MARHVKNWESLPEFSPPMSKGVARVLQIVRPNKVDTDQCHRDAMDAIRMIGSLPTFVPPNVVKQQLSEVVTELKAARTAINKLPLAWQNGLKVANLLSELACVSQKAEETANCLLVNKRSGGDRGKRTAALQKQIAAEQAFDLLKDWGCRTPTLTKNGEYHQLTGMLIEIATGRKSAGDVERACARVFQNLRKQGFPSATELRQQRRGRQPVSKIAPKELLKPTRKK